MSHHHYGNPVNQIERDEVAAAAARRGRDLYRRHAPLSRIEAEHCKRAGWTQEEYRAKRAEAMVLAEARRRERLN